jgi:hypothetical protein
MGSEPKIQVLGSASVAADRSAVTLNVKRIWRARYVSTCRKTHETGHFIDATHSCHCQVGLRFLALVALSRALDRSCGISGRSIPAVAAGWFPFRLPTSAHTSHRLSMEFDRNGSAKELRIPLYDPETSKPELLDNHLLRIQHLVRLAHFPDVARTKSGGAAGERARSDRPSRGRSHGDRGNEDVSRQMPDGFGRSSPGSEQVVLVPRRIVPHLNLIACYSIMAASSAA